ncbi:MAG: class I SAM-dependent methyltransferase [Magnetococcales bacterium]|nr:class I SAM-dependent methyltransferase [Magnetococcales bacterium]
MTVENKKSNILETESYLDIVFTEKRRPTSDYPNKLALHLLNTVYKKPGKILDIGCGRGDIMRAFHDIGFEVSGLDISPKVTELVHPHTAKIANLEQDPMPFEPESFDFIFSKSVIEHVHNPVRMMETAINALKPGGIAVIMTPSWIHNQKSFYLDHTHVMPFTAPSFEDVLAFSGLSEVNVIHFHQLPFLWKAPWLKPLIYLFSKIPLPYGPLYRVPWSSGTEYNKLVRFSKEIMLLGVGQKKGEK